MEQLFKIFLSAFETILLVLFLNTILTKIDEVEKERHTAYFLYFIFQCVTYLIDFPFFSTSYAYIAFTLLISIFFYYNEIRIKLVSSSMFVTLNYASKLLAASLFALLEKHPITTNPFKYVLNLKMQMMACLIMALVIFVIIIMRKLNKVFVRHLVNILIFILPLMILFMSMHLLEDLTTINLYFNIIVLLFCYTFLLFFIIDQIMFSNENYNQSQLIKERLQMQSTYYRDIEKYNKDMSRYKHDMMNHLHSIYGMLESKKYEDAENYLLSITDSMARIKPVINTGNAVIDVIFNSKVNLAKDNEIVCHNMIVVPPVLKIDAVDLSVILLNVLDNAIEASLKIKENRMIDTHIHIYKGALFISVKNRYNGEIKSSHTVYLSTKQNSREHGIGLINVNSVVQKYHGILNVEHDDEFFTISIMIPLENKK